MGKDDGKSKEQRKGKKSSMSRRGKKRKIKEEESLAKETGSTHEKEIKIGSSNPSLETNGLDKNQLPEAQAINRKIKSKKNNVGEEATVGELNRKSTNRSNGIIEPLLNIVKSNPDALPTVKSNTISSHLPLQTSSEDINSPCRKKTVKLLSSLPPASLSDISNAVHQSMKILLLRYSDAFGGVLLAFDNVTFETDNKKSGGMILDDMPHIHYLIEADVLLFCPDVGIKVRKLCFFVNINFSYV